ncbi:MAG: GGDEF domain-containing protein, partial [Gammaproteobacteria bacterium]
MNTRSDNYLDGLRMQVVSQLASLLESQTRNQIYVANIVQMFHNLHYEISAQLSVVQKFENAPNYDDPMSKIAADYARMGEYLKLLLSERAKQWLVDRHCLQTLMQGFNTTFDQLTEIRGEKRLFTRQNQSIERIVLSHERVTHWKEFIQDILKDVQQTFPFNYFFIACPLEKELSLYVYYAGSYSQSFRNEVCSALTRRNAKECQPNAMSYTFEEFILGTETEPDSTSNMSLLTAVIPPHAPYSGGLIGMALAAEKKITAHEESIIQAILAVLVMIIASSKSLSRPLSELKYIAVHDPLIHLYNHRHFNRLLEQEIKRAKRDRNHFSLVLLDIDDFKAINDRHGHAVGELALRTLSQIVRAHSRKNDIAARIGDGKLALALVESDRSGAERVANSIRKDLIERIISREDPQFRLSVSTGIAAYPQDANCAHALLTGAALTMRSAMIHGKNETICFHQATESAELKDEDQNQTERLRGAIREDHVAVG